MRLGALKTLVDYENYAGEVHNRQIDKPHWYLFVIGIHSEHQKKGYASKLLKPFLSYFDEEGISCYLETHRESNTEIYRNYNFDLVEVGQVPKTSVKHYAMLRKLQSLR
jgi:ribosomal protein S18 acetylase RimI-like enzyme